MPSTTARSALRRSPGSSPVRPSRRDCPGSDVLRTGVHALRHAHAERATARSSSRAAASRSPNRYRHLTRIEVRYASWDLGHIHLVDERTGSGKLARLYPQDKTQNASGLPKAACSIPGLDRIGPNRCPRRLRRTRPCHPVGPHVLDKQATTGFGATLSAQGRSHHRRRRDVMTKKLLALYGLKWNSIRARCAGRGVARVVRRIRRRSFCWRAEQLVGEGGFALVTGAPGTGKSVTLRILAERLGAAPDDQRSSGILTEAASRPSGLLSMRWATCSASNSVPPTAGAGAQEVVARFNRWQTHIDAALSRPVPSSLTRPRRCRKRSSPSCDCYRRPVSTATSCSPSCSPVMAACSNACALRRVDAAQ